MSAHGAVAPPSAPPVRFSPAGRDPSGPELPGPDLSGLAAARPARPHPGPGRKGEGQARSGPESPRQARPGAGDPVPSRPAPKRPAAPRTVSRRRRGLGAAMAALTAAGLASSPAWAQEGPFAAGSQAESWGLAGEEKARFSARVVDVLCELTGDCPQDCGAGRRQLGLLREADGALVLAAKNGQPLFTGAGLDLLAWCGQTVEVDGLMVGDPQTAPARVFQVQLIRGAETDGFVKADRWTQAWGERYPDLADLPGPWFRKDPRVMALVERDGWLGLGLETDARFLEEWFP